MLTVVLVPESTVISTVRLLDVRNRWTRCAVMVKEPSVSVAAVAAAADNDNDASTAPPAAPPLADSDDATLQEEQ